MRWHGRRHGAPDIGGRALKHLVEHHGDQQDLRGQKRGGGPFRIVAAASSCRNKTLHEDAIIHGQFRAVGLLDLNGCNQPVGRRSQERKKPGAEMIGFDVSALSLWEIQPQSCSAHAVPRLVV